MRAVDVIRKKRDRQELSREEIEAFARAAADGSWPDYQLSALLMAVCLNGMTAEEVATLTAAMANSGMQFRWDDVPGPKVDKHSTGGVGDKTSLVLAPLAAACGVVVPMMSGRGLGHTGGTLDKLESIPGFRVDLEQEELRVLLKTIGVGMIGQTAKVAPADRTLYALRDVTGTVENVPLITASILSKKLAEGIDALVMDVKAGRGAFMKTRKQAKTLAESIVRIGNANGVRTEALITSMDVPLGRAVGNSLEVVECLETLKGRGPKDVEDLSVTLAARMVRLAKLAGSNAEAELRVRSALTSGAGLERFREIVERQGGDPRVVDDYTGFARAPRRATIAADRAGYVTDLDAEQIGIGAMILGGGRNRAEDRVDHSVGVVVRAAVGQAVRDGDVILDLHYREEAKLANSLPILRGAVAVGDAPTATHDLILDEIRDDS
jgi:pyrimidine-nucleoside phosphorylase